MASILKPQAIFSASNPLVSMEVGCLGGIRRVGVLREDERGMGQLSAWDCDKPTTPSHYPRPRIHRHTERHRHCTDPVSTLALEVDDGAGAGLSSSLIAI